MENETTSVPLMLLDEPPERVEGAHAFVLYQPEIGRIEIGRPLPGDEIWNHFTGDLRFTAVHELTGGVSGGGGPIRDDGQLDVLWSDGSGDDPNERAWVVAGLIALHQATYQCGLTSFTDGIGEQQLVSIAGSVGSDSVERWDFPSGKNRKVPLADYQRFRERYLGSEVKEASKDRKAALKSFEQLAVEKKWINGLEKNLFKG